MNLSGLGTVASLGAALALVLVSPTALANPGMAAAAPQPGAKAAPAAPAADAPVPHVELRAPLFSEAFASVPVARIGEDLITLDELSAALSEMHDERAGGGERAGKRDFRPALNRIIDTRLIVLEARGMAFDELPEVKKEMEEFQARTAREILKARTSAAVEPDAAEVARALQGKGREWKVASVLVTGQDPLGRWAEAQKGAASFEAAVQKLVAGGDAKSLDEKDFVSSSKLRPEIVAALEKLEKGGVSAPIQVEGGYAVVKVVDARVVEDPKARAAAENASRDRRREEALREHYAALSKQLAKVNVALLKALDYHAKKPGLVGLAKDKRVLVTLKGAAPLTVADLTLEIERRYYHGAQRAAEEKKINKKKQEIFDSLLYRRLLDVEAKRAGIQESKEYLRAVSERERAMLFGMFVERVVVPKVQVKESEGKEYFEKHKSEYTYPRFYRLASLSFKGPKEAQAAIAKMKAGADAGWIRANAEGLLPEEDGLNLKVAPYSVAGLTDEMGQALAGATTGDHRLYQSPDGKGHVITVVEDIAPAPQPYEQARESVLRKVETQKINDALDEWAKKLRQAHGVEIFVTALGT